MDGTIFESSLDWLTIRQHLEIADGTSILSEIYRDGWVDERRLKILEDFERKNTLEARPMVDVGHFLDYLRAQHIPCVLITNNNRDNTRFLLNRYKLEDRFALVMTRETRMWKPDPDAFIYALNSYGCKGEEAVSIGDSHYDVKASRGAGIAHIYIIRNRFTNTKSLHGLEGEDLSYFDNYNQLQEIFQHDVCMSTCRHQRIEY